MSSIEKGAFHLLVSKAVFFLSGYALVFILGRWFLTTEEFGLFGVVFTINSLVTNILITGIQQAVAKFVSEAPEKAEIILRQSLKTQLFFSIAMFIGFFLSADLIAGLLNEPRLALYFRIVAFVPLIQPFYSAMGGYLNGLKKFREQAGFYNLYRILRAGIPISMAAAGFALFGVFTGLVFAALASLLVGIFSIGTGKSGDFSKKKIFLFSAPIIFYALILNSFMSIDLLFLKALTQGANSNVLAGFYTAAQTVARVPFELAMTITMILFPLVSGTVAAQKKQKAAFYISSAYRYTFIAVAPFAVMFFTTAHELLSLVYGQKFLEAGSTLGILSLGFVFMALFSISETIISARGSPSKAALIAFSFLIAEAALLYLLVPLFSMEGAAFASLAAMALGAIVSSAVVFAQFRSFPFRSIAKTCIACIIIFLASVLFPASGMLLIPKYLLLTAIFLGAMFLLKEIKNQDMRIFLKMVS
ncbi:MAG TPA: oligosaccharide flippase family protein [archaeon]|nr:oligosaccharide flippase family protein [archaeon]